MGALKRDKLPLTNNPTEPYIAYHIKLIVGKKDLASTPDSSDIKVTSFTARLPTSWWCTETKLNLYLFYPEVPVLRHQTWGDKTC